MFVSKSEKHWTRLERLARNKHSSLLRKLVNYGRKRFFSYAPPNTLGTKPVKILEAYFLQVLGLFYCPALYVTLPVTLVKIFLQLASTFKNTLK
jgi:hypothetical protein